MSIKDTLKEFTLDELKKKHELKTPIISSDDREILGVRLSEEIFTYSHEQKDPYILNVPRRKRISEKLLGDGKTVYWFQVCGLMEAGFGSLATSGGTIPANIGFDAGGMVAYRYLFPHPAGDGEPGIEEALKKLVRFPLPLNPESAQEVYPGSEFELVGEGNARLTATAGWSLENGVFKGTAGASVQVSGEGCYAVTLVKQDQNHMRVFITADTVQTVDLGLGVEAGITVNRLLSQKLLTAQLENDKLVELIRERGLEPLGDLVKDYDTFQAKLNAITSTTCRETTAFTFALDKSDAKKAYAQLMHLDDELALQYARENPAATGVSLALSTFNQKQTTVSAEAKLRNARLLLCKALFIEAERTHLEDGDFHIKRTNLIPREREILGIEAEQITWEDVRLSYTDLDSEEKKEEVYTFAHLSYSITDKITREEELIRFVRFAKVLGLYSGADLPNPHLWKDKLFTSKNDTVGTLDLYFSGPALQDLHNVSRNTFWHHFVEVMKILEPELGELPFANREVRKTYFTGDKIDGVRKGQNWIEPEMKALGDKYQANLKREISDDVEYYAMGKNIFKTLAGRKKAELDWRTIIVDLGRKYKFDFILPISLCVHLCNRKEVFVHQLELKGYDFDFISVDEEQLVVPEKLQIPESFYTIEDI